MFCIQDDKDACKACVEKLMEKYPKVNARIFTGGENVGVNPKINNMLPAYKYTNSELILISDSGIRSKSNLFTKLII